MRCRLLTTPSVTVSLSAGTPSFCGRHLDQYAARFGGGDAHLLAAVLDAGGAGGAALVHAGGGVAHEYLDGLERHIELFGNHLADGDEDALAHVHLAEIGIDGAVGVDRNEGRELIRRERRLRSHALRVGGLHLQHSIERRPACRPTRRTCRRPAGSSGGRTWSFFHFGHDRLPQPIISAARLTARMMPICVPQRHLRPVSASLIWASVGFFFSLSSAAADMIQPLMQ